MRYSIVVIMMGLMMGLSLSSYAQKSKDRDFFTVKVEGLGCPFCAYGLEKKFKEFKGIKDTKIEMETGIFTFTYPAEKALTLEQVEKQVVAAGYTPADTRIERADGTVEASEKEEISSDTPENANWKEAEIFVAGNCGMCKARIEKAATGVKGVASAEWNKKTKQLSLKYDAGSISIEDVESAIAESGHDTRSAKADDKTYDNLPACCLYDRD